MTDSETRELDAWIELNVFKTIAKNLAHDKSDSLIPRKKWSSDPAAALEVLEKCGKYLTPYAVTIVFSGTGDVICDTEHYRKDVRSSARTLPLAIALFAKKLFA